MWLAAAVSHPPPIPLAAQPAAPLATQLDRAAAALAAMTPADAEVARLRDATSAYLREHGAAALRRRPLGEHLTASAVVLDPTGSRTLLCLHTKGQFWVQPGGHVDPEDEDLLAGALRELREETGAHVSAVPDAVPIRVPIDIDRHALGDRFGTCRWHVDVGFLVIVDPAETLAVSTESQDVAWWPVDALPEPAADGVAQRVGRAQAALRSHRTSGSTPSTAAP